MATDCVELLPSTADALCDLVCHVGRVNVDLPAMAWLALVCRALPDDPARFPHGKWATIQRIESQLANCAAVVAAEIASRP